MGVPKTSDHIWIKVKRPKPSKEPPASSKALNQDMVVLCTFKIKIHLQNLEYECIKDKLLYPNQDQDPKTSQEPPESWKAKT